MLNDAEDNQIPLIDNALPEHVWVTDTEGELVFFATVQDGQVTEWVWL